MALMGFREPNQVKWVGTRPAHRGTQITKSDTAANATTILHTVTAGKVFYLCGFTFCVYLSAAGIWTGLIVRDAGGVTQYHLANICSPIVDSQVLSLEFMVPLEIPSAYDVCTYSLGVTAISFAFIHGWEE